MADGTKLFTDFEAIPHGWFKLIFPLFLARLRKEEKANMGYIRETLESRVCAGIPQLTAPRSTPRTAQGSQSLSAEPSKSFGDGMPGADPGWDGG